MTVELRGRREVGGAGGPPVDVELADFALFGGLHCETSALRKALQYRGTMVSEHLLFGLGGGIGFVYWRDRRSPIPFVGGRNGKFPQFLARATERLSIPLDVCCTRSRTVAWSNLTSELARGQPVVCYGDIFHLPYFHSARHFGGHAFVVYGVSETRDRVLVSDRGVHPRSLTLAQLADARASRSQPFPPKNAQLQLGAAPASLRPAGMREAILSSCRALCAPPIAGLGLPGLQRFARELVDHADHAGPAQHVEHRASAYVNLHLAGTGGLAFRPMYRTFLLEAADHLGLDERIAHAIAALDASIGAWRALLDALLPRHGALGRLRAFLDAKERMFERGTMDEIRAYARETQRAPAMWADAAAEIADGRDDHVDSIESIAAAIRAAETEMCAHLARAVGGGE